MGNSEVFSELRSRQYVEMDVFKLQLVSLAGWMNRQQQEVIDYLQEEVRVLKEMPEKRGGKRYDLPTTSEPVWLAKPRESDLVA